MAARYFRTCSITFVRRAGLAFAPGQPYSPLQAVATLLLRRTSRGGVAIMEKHKFIFVRWPNGEWTIALDREYDFTEMAEF